MAIQLSPRMDIKPWLRNKELAKNVIFFKEKSPDVSSAFRVHPSEEGSMLLGLEETRLPQQEASGQPQYPEPCILVLE